MFHMVDWFSLYISYIVRISLALGRSLLVNYDRRRACRATLSCICIESGVDIESKQTFQKLEKSETRFRVVQYIISCKSIGVERKKLFQNYSYCINAQWRSDIYNNKCKSNCQLKKLDGASRYLLTCLSLSYCSYLPWLCFFMWLFSWLEVVQE